MVTQLYVYYDAGKISPTECLAGSVWLHIDTDGLCRDIWIA